MPKPKVIVFDLDGVILDSNKITATLFKTSFPTATEELYKQALCGNYFEAKERLGISELIETQEEKEARLAKYALEKLECAFFDGIPELVKELHGKQYSLAINTSSRENNCLPSLQKINIDKFFDFIGTKEVSKSKVEKFKMIIEKYQVEPKDIIFVTDTLGDLREAQISRIPTIAVTWGIHDRSYFTSEPHDNLIAIVDTVAELREKILEGVKI